MDEAIRTHGLTKHYGATVALDRLDLCIPAGEVVGYLGPNGAGKSTTLGLLLGLLRPTAGWAELLGCRVDRAGAALHRRIAHVPSEADLWPSLTGRETLELMARLHGSVDTAYRDVLLDRFALDADLRNRAYSHGNRQKVLLVAAFASRAELLLLDEPTTGLDPLMEEVFRTCVAEARDRGQTVLLSSHILSEVEAVCDTVAMLRAGRLISYGPLAALRSLAAQQVHATFAGAPPALDGVPGVTAVVVDGSDLRCEVTGPVEPLLAALVGHGLERLTTREPSLEELFLRHYDDADHEGGPAPERG